LLSCNFAVTKYLDSVSLNKLTVIGNNGKTTENLFEYLKKEFEIEKKGTSKNFLTIVEDRHNISNDWLASVLFSEIYYEKNDFLSTVIDKDIMRILSDENGRGQYKYATVYAYRNVLVQILDTHYQQNKIEMECVTLFYIELILFEEATIEKANDEIIPFLVNIDKYRPKEILQIINGILSEHVQSINFWNVQMSYPSSQKSIDYIRNAFDIENKRAVFQRNQKELLMIYDIRSDMVDKEETKFISIIVAVFTVIAATLAVISTIGSTFDLRNTIIMTSVCVSIIAILIAYRRQMHRKIHRKEKHIKKLLNRTNKQ